MLNKNSQNYNFLEFYFVIREVETAALIFCVMFPSLVDTSLDFGLFRVVRPYVFLHSCIYNNDKACIII